MIKCVVFDLDNTVYDYDRCHHAAMKKLSAFVCRKYHISETKFDAAYAKAKQKVKLQLGNTGSSHNRILYMQRFLEEIGASPVERALDLYNLYWNTILEDMQLFQYVLPLMEALKEKSVQIAVLTDLTAHIQHRKIHKLGLAKYIDVLVTSEEAGVEKPALKAFELLIEKCGTRPEEMLMIGDSRERDIEGAINAGMQGILLEKGMENSIDSICLRRLDEYTNSR